MIVGVVFLVILGLGGGAFAFFWKPAGGGVAQEAQSAGSAGSPIIRDRSVLSLVDAIRQSLDAYHKGAVGYPEILAALVPQYLPAAPAEDLLPRDAYRQMDSGSSYTLTYTIQALRTEWPDTDHETIGALRTVAIVPGTHEATPSSIAADLSRNAPPEATQEAEAPAVNASGVDEDSDGLGDEEEVRLGTDPKLRDTDGDALSDFQEINIYSTNPLAKDTDLDSYADDLEIRTGYNPLGPGKNQ